MSVKRFPVEGRGRCTAVVSDGLVYAVATDPHSADGIIEQTKNTLAELDDILGKAGSDKTQILQATVYLTNMAWKSTMDSVWIPWIGKEENWPQRACVGVDLAENDLIEIVVTAKVL